LPCLWFRIEDGKGEEKMKEMKIIQYKDGFEEVDFKIAEEAILHVDLNEISFDKSRNSFMETYSPKALSRIVMK
jgi:hypothetical protein